MSRVLVSSALGESDQPDWPEWNPEAISEGLGRWLWAAVFGLALGGFPIVVYWISCGSFWGNHFSRNSAWRHCSRSP